MRLPNAQFLLTLATASMALAQVEVVATGLLAPQKLLLTPRGNFLVSETSMQTNQGRISYVSRSGVRRSLFEGLPSGTEVAGGGSGPSAMLLKDRTLYVGFGGGDSERRNATGQSIHNPAGVSSQLFVSIIEIRFNSDIDQISGTFQITPAQQTLIADGDTVTLEDGSLGRATINVLVRFPTSTPDGTGYRFSNLWSLALTDDGTGMWVIDASQNSLSRVDLATGKWQRLMRFAPVRNPTPVGPPVTDAVPTSVRVYGDQLLVSFLSGFPFARGETKVLAINPGSRTFEPFINGLTSCTDIFWRARPGQRAQFFALEFSINQSDTPAGPGRLLRYDGLDPVVVASDLRAPVNMAYDAATEELFILELSGRILKTSIR